VSSSATRFVILAAPRTGSNMLCTLVGSHPDVLCHHELFNPRGVFYALELRDGSFGLGGIEERDRDPIGFLERVWAADLGHTHVGFKMTHRQNEAALDAVLQDRRVRKIVLRRENRVRTFVSQQISEQLDEWEVYSEADLVCERPRVRVDPDALRTSIAENEAYYGELEASLEATGQPFLRVSYERLLDGNADQGRVLEFLGVPDPARAAAVLRIRSVRQNPGPLRELVANFDELEHVLAGTALAAELEGP
jgi:hypothetical protein